MRAQERPPRAARLLRQVGPQHRAAQPRARRLLLRTDADLVRADVRVQRPQERLRDGGRV